MRGHLIDTVRLAIEFIRFGGGCRGYNSSISFEQKILKLEEDNQLAEEEIAKIRREFDAAKQSFFKIPDALKGMQKMDPNGIYVNKNLRLENIQVYGFDYDYTLAHYSANLQSLIYELAKEHLVNEFWYPGSCLEFKYDPTFPIRGLYYDKLKGCLLKLDFFGSIEPDGCYFGRRKFTKKEIEQIYGTRHIGRDQARGLVSLMDFFCFSEACLIADIVQHFVDAKLEFDAPYVYQDVNRAIQHVHGSGLAHRGILSDPQRYLVKNSQLLRFLRMLKENGKKLFLLTNSPYYFVDGGMRFMLEGCDHQNWKYMN
ncbi:5'-nucleotidase domain-containing protein DDB_G0275467-like [Camellia sinensis]|uniref:5'-nucleotidase domain-containing protein DDB_G0275467-like n=1 Tax=Camellia sinensis TaxID=4442 RepID=UPI001035D09A|nr:5'-nucleotidase domain-containing protein DDB_G0275467-like [Camellia sinensis]